MPLQRMSDCARSQTPVSCWMFNGSSAKTRSSTSPSLAVAISCHSPHVNDFRNAPTSLDEEGYWQISLTNPSARTKRLKDVCAGAGLEPANAWCHSALRRAPGRDRRRSARLITGLVQLLSAFRILGSLGCHPVLQEAAFGALDRQDGHSRVTGPASLETRGCDARQKISTCTWIETLDPATPKHIWLQTRLK